MASCEEQAVTAQREVDAAYLLHDSLYACSQEERVTKMAAERDRVLGLVTALEVAFPDESEQPSSEGAARRAAERHLRGVATWSPPQAEH